MPENWKPIKGYEGSYEVSDMGQVRSLDRFITRRNPARDGDYIKHFMRGRIMRPHTTADNQVRVTLTDSLGPMTHAVGRLVLETFRPKDVRGRQISKLNVRHKDRDQQNNALSNLSWSTPDKVAQHVSHYRFKNLRRTIDNQKIRSAKKLVGQGYTQAQIASMLCITQSTVSKINTGEIRERRYG